MVGKTIGKFKVLCEIGRGGMGVVYKGLQISLNRTVALKMLPSQMALSQEFLERFQREARILARLNHKNIVHIYDLEEFKGSFFIVMEYIEGDSLAKLIAERAPLPTVFIKRVALGVASALAAAHKTGIIHRDIKPENIMVDAYDEVKVMDFGIARAADQACKTRTGIRLGTPEYMSPEQAKGMAVEASSDIYSLGIVLYEMACGKVPFAGEDSIGIALKHIQETPEPPSLINPRIHPELEGIILKTLEKDKSLRFKDADELARSIEKVTVTEEETLVKEKPLKFMFCPSCGASLQEDFLRCPECGLVVRRQCPYCREAFDAVYEVCPHCSKELPPLKAESAPKTLIAPVAPEAGEAEALRPARPTAAREPARKIPGVLAKPWNLALVAAGLVVIVVMAILLSSGKKKSSTEVISQTSGTSGQVGPPSPPAPNPSAAQNQQPPPKSENPPSLNELNEMLSKARDYFDRGAYDLCIQQSQGILDWNPGQMEAQALVQRAADAKPKVVIYLADAQKALREARYSDCLEECGKIIAISPRHQQAQQIRNLAEAQVQAGGTASGDKKEGASGSEGNLSAQSAAETALVQSLIERQRKAMETANVPLLLQDVTPELQAEIRAGAGAFFSQNRVFKVAFGNIAVRVLGDEAEVSLISSISYVPAGTNQVQDQSSPVNWRLKKVGADWKIIKF